MLAFHLPVDKDEEQALFSAGDADAEREKKLTGVESMTVLANIELGI